MKQYFLPISILIAGVMVSGTVLYTSARENPGVLGNAQDSQGEQEATGASGGEQGLVTAVTASDHSRGASSDEARVTVIEYLDYRCSFCAKFHPTMKRLVEENDDVQWVSRHFAIFGEDPAIASECVAKLAGEEQFQDFSTKLFENQQRIGRDYFEELATSYGVSESEFTQCVSENEEIPQEVAQESREARDAGAQGTPFSVIVDNETGEMYPVSGAVPYSSLMSRIEDIREG